MNDLFIKILVSLALVLLLGVTVILSKAYPYDLYDVSYVRCYDADTCTVTIPYVHPFFGESIPIRVRGVNAPEIRGACENEKELAKDAKFFVEQVLKHAHRIDLRNVERGKYFRIVADIFVDNRPLLPMILQETSSVEYDGGTRTNVWCPED